MARAYNINWHNAEKSTVVAAGEGGPIAGLWTLRIVAVQKICCESHPQQQFKQTIIRQKISSSSTIIFNLSNFLIRIIGSFP